MSVIFGDGSGVLFILSLRQRSRSLMGLSRIEFFKIGVLNLLSSCTASHLEATPSGEIEKGGTT